MKKIFLLCLGLSLLILVGCLPLESEHTIRDEPTDAEYQALVESLKDSTVNLIGYYMTFELSLGSGLIYHKEPSKDDMYYYYVVTNNHVVSSMSHMLVKTNQGNEEIGDIYAVPTQENDRDDIAIVRFESAFDYPLIDIMPLTSEKRTSIQLAIGQTVFGIGTPVSKDNFNLSSNLGIISDLSSNYISHTANINPGNSGGPLFSYDGTFIGINTQRVEIIEGETIYLIGDAIHVNRVAQVITRRISEVTPRLGITIVPYAEFVGLNYAEEFGEQGEDFNPYDYVPQSSFGVTIIEVASTRSSFGILERFDLIQAVNGVTITSNTDLFTAIGTISSGRTYNFEVLRFNQETRAFDRLILEVIIPWNMY